MGQANKKVMVSGCFDLFHSGHLEFFRQASKFGDLYVSVAKDETIKLLKNIEPTFNQDERKFIIENLTIVKEAFIPSGVGMMDFKDDLIKLKPDFFVVNDDGDKDEKRKLCESLRVEYVVLKRVPREGLPLRNSTELREGSKGTSGSQMNGEQLPLRLCLAGSWIDQSFINRYASGSLVDINIKYGDHFVERGGLATSTRKIFKDMVDKGLRVAYFDPEKLAEILFYLENGEQLARGYKNPELNKGYIAGSQDHIGLTHKGITRMDYHKEHRSGYWPINIENNNEADVCDWFERNLVLVPIGVRSEGYDALVGMKPNRDDVEKLGSAGVKFYNAILDKDLEVFGKCLTETHEAVMSIFPNAMSPEVDALVKKCAEMGTGAMTTGYGNGYVAIATDKDVPNGFRIKVNR